MKELSGFHVIMFSFLMTKSRRRRTEFTDNQIAQLEAIFVANNNPTKATRKQLAQYLLLQEDVINVWFKNRRAKQRRQSISSKYLPFFKHAKPFLYSQLSCEWKWKKGLTATRTLECENQGTTKRLWLKIESVGVAQKVCWRSWAMTPHVKHTECVPSLKLPYKYTSIACGKKTSLVYSSCKSSRLIENIILRTSTRTRRRRTGAQLKPRATTIKASLRLRPWTWCMSLVSSRRTA